MRMRRLLWAAATLLLAAPAAAKVSDVFPGPGTPLQDAIAAASPKDTLRVHLGTYDGAIVIDKPLKLIAKDRAIIDAGCTEPTTVTIASDDVRMAGFSLRGATFSQLEVGAHDRVKLETIGGIPDCVGVQHGIRAVGAKRLLIRKTSYSQFDTLNRGLGCHQPLTPQERLFAGAAVYVRDTPADARIQIKEAFMCLVSTGIRLENVAALPVGPPPVLLQRNAVQAAYRGLQLVAADRVTIQASRIRSLQPGAIAGIDLDAASDDNVLAQNTIEGFPADVVDAGTSNCWRPSNHYTTGSVPTTGCP